MSRLFRSIAAMFLPPFEGLGLMVVLYFVWAHIVYPHNDVVRGNLPDPDDYMYLAQVMDWLGGHGWYDNVQHRLDPPTGTPIHFSRFAQMPLALGMLVFEQLGLKARGAATLTALIEPLVLLGCCLSLLRRVTAYVVSPRWAGASAWVALFSVGLLFEFMPGHVDHHGLVIVLMLAAMERVLRMIQEPADLKAAATAGLILAFAAMIALECLPWLLLLAAWLGVWSMSRGGQAATGGAVFALGLLGGSAVCLGLTRPPAAWMEADTLTYSVTYVALAACITLPFLGVALAGKAAPATRWAVGVALAMLCAGLFLRRFPDMAGGPYGGIDPQLLPLLLNEMEEAKPILHTDHGGMNMLNFMSMSLLALPIGMVFAGRARGAARWQWGLLAALLLAGCGLTIFYQYRFLGMTNALSAMPLTALLERGWAWTGRHLHGRRKVLAEIGLLLAVGPLFGVIVPASADGRSFSTGILLFPVDSSRSRCDMAALEGVLRDPNGLGSQPRLILSEMELGPELLFRTDDAVLAAPYHMNVQGNLDAARFLSTPYPAEAENIARRRGVDLVIACNAVPGHYLTAKDVGLPTISRLFSPTPPEWLERVPAPGVDNFVVFRTRPPSSKTWTP